MTAPDVAATLMRELQMKIAAHRLRTEETIAFYHRAGARHDYETSCWRAHMDYVRPTLEQIAAIKRAMAEYRYWRDFPSPGCWLPACVKEGPAA